MTEQRLAQQGIAAPLYEKPVPHRLFFPAGIAREDRWSGFCGALLQSCSLISNSTLVDGNRQTLTPTFRGSTLVLRWECEAPSVAPRELSLYRHTRNDLELFCPALDLMVRLSVVASRVLCPDAGVGLMSPGGDRSGWLVARELAREAFGWRVPSLSMIGEFPDNDIDGHMMAFYAPTALFEPALKGPYVRNPSLRRWQF